MKFKLIKEISKKEWNNKIYSNGYYDLSIRKKPLIDYTDIVIIKKTDSGIEYLPTVFIKEDLYKDNYAIENITIDVVGRGSLEVEEIEEIIKGYNIAIETVKELKELLKEYM